MSTLKGKIWAYLRLLVLILVGFTAISAGGLFFSHEGWNTTKQANNTHHGKGGLFVEVFNLAVSLGPMPVGACFLILGLLAWKMAHVQYAHVRRGDFQGLTKE